MKNSIGRDIPEEILNTYHKKPPYKNMCFDSFRKKINSQFKFDLFEYSLLK